MASIIRRNNSYSVVYWTTIEGKRKQKWETYHSEAEALKRKKDIENADMIIVDIDPQINTMNQLLYEYIDLYGKLNWSISTYTARTTVINNYIRPHIGRAKLNQISNRYMSRFFFNLQTHPLVSNKYRPNHQLQMTEQKRFEIYKLLHSVFQQATSWGCINGNPISHISFPKPHQGVRKSLKPKEIMLLINKAIELGKLEMALIIQLAFVCSMRKGEILGLCWKNDSQSGIRNLQFRL